VTGLWHGPLAWTTAAAPVAPTAPVVPVVPARGRAGGERNGTLFLGKGDIFHTVLIFHLQFSKCFFKKMFILDYFGLILMKKNSQWVKTIHHLTQYLRFSHIFV